MLFFSKQKRIKKKKKTQSISRDKNITWPYILYRKTCTLIWKGHMLIIFHIFLRDILFWIDYLTLDRIADNSNSKTPNYGSKLIYKKR